MKKLYTILPVFFAGMFLGVSLISTVAPHPARAALGSDIVCFVYDQLNHVGTPLPVLNANDCQNPPSVPAQCSDGIDNDGDGLIDFPADPGCSSAIDNNEFNVTVSLPACMDGIDNDSDELTDSADPGCHTDGNASNPLSYSPADTDETDPAPPSGTENTLALCSNTVDDDDDGLIDLADPHCSAYIPKVTVTKIVSGGAALVSDFSLFLDGLGITSGIATTTSVGSHAVSETASSTYPGTFGGACDSTGHVSLAIGDSKSCTLTNTFTSEDNDETNTTAPPAVTTSHPQCSDGVDNDGDGRIDYPSDGSCSDLGDDSEGNDGGGGFIGSSDGGGGGGSIGFFQTQGIVLGTSTTCGVYLADYLRMGRQNNPDQVKKLQTFLNTHINAKLPVTGFFGRLTDAAVRRFQLQYNADVLAPWVPHGLQNAQTPTGYVYKTTLHKINALMCESLNISLPRLP